MSFMTTNKIFLLYGKYIIYIMTFLSSNLLLCCCFYSCCCCYSNKQYLKCFNNNIILNMKRNNTNDFTTADKCIYLFK